MLSSVDSIVLQWELWTKHWYKYLHDIDVKKIQNPVHKFFFLSKSTSY